MTALNLLFISNDEGTLLATDGSTVTVLADGASPTPFSADPIYYGVSGVASGSTAYLILSASTGSTSALWKYDGTTATQITSSSDYVYNQQDYNTTVNPYPLASYLGDLVFSQASIASNTDNSFDTATLSIYDPNTGMITQPAAPHGGYDPHDFVTLNGTLYFEATDSTTQNPAIYSYNGSAVTEIYNAHPTYFNSVFNGNYTAAGAVQGPLTAFNGNLYFGSGQQSVYELTSLGSLSNAATDVAGSAQYNYGIQPATDLIAAGTHLFFSSSNNGIYSLSTTNGLTQVLGSLGAQSFTPVLLGATLYFVAYNPNTQTPNLYTSSGGAASVAISGFNASNLLAMGSTIYYSGGNAGLGTTNGSTTGTLTAPNGIYGQPLLVTGFPDVSYGGAALPPSVTAGATATFAGGGPAVVLDSALTVTDPSSATLAGATVTISTGFQSGDTLALTSQNGITGAWNAATGVLTLSGSSSVANYQTALASITYRFAPGNTDPTGGGSDTSRAISWTVTDGTNTSAAATSTLNVTHVPPVIFTDPGTVTFTGGGTAAVLDPGAIVSDLDSGGLLQGATVSISGGFVAGDFLGFTNQNGITGSYNGSTGVLTLTGSATLGQYDMALQSVTYSTVPANADPTEGGSHTTRTISWTATDGVAASNTTTRTLNVVHTPPTVTAGATAAFTVGGPPVPLDPTLSISDPDSGGTLSGASVAITGGFNSGDLLAFSDQNGISGNYNGALGVLTLSGSASLANYQTALQSVAYYATGNPTSNGTDLSRGISWSVSDGVAASGAATSTVNLSVPQPVIAGTASGQTTTDENSLHPFAGVSITDPNSGATETVTVTLSDATNGTLADLSTGSYDANAGIYSISGSATQVTSALDALTFVPTAHQVAPGSTVTTGLAVGVTDSYTGTASDSTTTVVATAVDDAPAMVGIWAYQGVPNQASDTPFSGVSVIDPDIGHTETVTVTLSGAGGSLSDDIAGGFDDSTGVYTVTGDRGTVEAALQALSFTPPAATGEFLQTTTLAVDVTNSGGSADGTLTVTSVQQILGLAAAPLEADLVEVSPDGTGLPDATPEANNEAIINDPAADGSYTLPSSYQAAFLGGSVNASLTDPSVGNALLVGNNADDILIALGDNDTVFGGVGQNSVSADGFGDLVLLHGAATLDAGGDSGMIDLAAAPTTATISGSSVSVLGSAAGSMTADITGDDALLSAGGAELIATITGSGAVIFGGSDPGAGMLQIESSGAGVIIDAFASDASIDSSGDNAQVIGGSGNTAVTLSGSGDTVFGGSGAMSVTGGDNGAPTIVGSGPSGQITVGGGGLVLAESPGNDAATITAGAGPVTAFGSAGASILLQGSGAGALFVVGDGNETLSAAPSSTDNLFSGSADSTGAALMIGGSGADTMIGGAGNDTMAGGDGDNIFAFFAAGTDGQHDVITDFSSNDSLLLLNYAPGASAVSLVQSAVTDQSGVTLTLSDNTQITFSNMTDVTPLYGHILYAPAPA